MRSGVYRGLVEADDVAPPFLMDSAANMARNLKIEAAMGLARWVGQRHSCFFGGSATFLYVAPDAGTDDVFPGIFAATRSRNNMIQRQRVARMTTVLTGMAVSVQKITPG